MADKVLNSACEKVSKARSKKSLYVIIALVVLIVGILVIFLGTFIYYVSAVRTYKTACPSTTIRANALAVVLWIIGPILFLGAIALFIFALVTKASPAGVAASAV